MAKFHGDNNIKKFKNKLLISILVITIVFILITLNLYFLIKNNNEEYNRIVLSQRQNSYTQLTTPYRRGDILDINGLPLARSVKVYNLILDPKVIYSKKDNRYVEATINALNNFGYDRGEKYEQLENRKETSYFRLDKHLSYEKRNEINEYINKTNEEYLNNDNKERIKGIWFEEEYKREHSYGSLASNVIGFVDNEGTSGQMGLELYYNDDLSGVNGRRYGYLDVENNLDSITKEAIDGNTIITTINTQIQATVEKYLYKWQNEDIGSKKASVIVMNPNTAEIMAMASTNNFDLDNPRDISNYKDEELYELGKEALIRDYKIKNGVELQPVDLNKYYDYNQVLNAGKSEIWYKNWYNCCVSDTYEPGSTSKVITAAAALEENLVNKNTTFKCEGKIEFNDGIHKWKIRCNNRQGHGELNVEESIMVSCNMCMAEMADLLGSNRFSKYQHIFGLGQKTNIDLPAEADTKNLIYKSKDLGRTALATNSFGQNYNCTMIQMANVYASIINGGNLYEPHIVRQIKNSSGSLVKDIEPKLIRKTVSEKTCEIIKNALFRTVEEGTGKSAIVDGYEIGGKTGTAEKLPRSAKNYLVSFCGFAPVNNPEVLIYVIVDTPNLKGEAQAKATFATKIFKDIMTETLSYLNIKPDNDSYNEFNLNKVIKEGIKIATYGNAVKITINDDKEKSRKLRINVKDEVITNTGKDEDNDELPELLPDQINS